MAAPGNQLKPNADAFRRLCVFCNQRPGEGSNEHPVPMWLIRRTGDPQRIATFDGAGYGKLSRHAFSQYKMPACLDCNARYQLLEDGALRVFARLWSNQPLFVSDIEILLDWVDKLRISTWRMHLIRTGNPYGISPRFYVDNEVGRFDSILWVLRTKPTGHGQLTLLHDRDVFPGLPNHFGIVANNLGLVCATESRLADTTLGHVYWHSGPRSHAPPGCLVWDLAARRLSDHAPRSLYVPHDAHAAIFVRPRLWHLEQINENDAKGHYGLIEPIVLAPDDRGLFRPLNRHEPIHLVTTLLKDLDDVYYSASRLLARVRMQMVILAEGSLPSEQDRRMRAVADALLKHMESHDKESFIAEKLEAAKTGRPVQLSLPPETIPDSPPPIEE